MSLWLRRRCPRSAGRPVLSKPVSDGEAQPGVSVYGATIQLTGSYILER